MLDRYPLPELERYQQCQYPHFHVVLAPFGGVLLIPITLIAEAYSVCIDGQKTVTLTFEATANLLQEIGRGEN